MSCKYNLELPYTGDCAGCAASYWLDDGIMRKEYGKPGRFACKIEEGLMTVEEVRRENEETVSKWSYL